ncbi:MepB family protein [Paenarthrobacter ilicis]|uniref:Metallopeptidase n=1 Tax=Paenarthrobacter ilicis TaxID=43665 RepID=A0ABX0TG99_9MICC|nr:hypothetical protein [Paenarthrobacter ilicis]NIJ00911.1 hypothetical protein [Paenarthrobacter ilicis]
MNFQSFQRFIGFSNGSDCVLAGLRVEEQNSDYESGIARLGEEHWRIRTARITPKKPGAFVALWKRDEDGSTRPFTAGEAEAGLLVFVEDQQRFGVFRFTAADLVALGYVSSGLHPGRRGFRVYPAWCTDLNAQALRTQRAQLPAFSEHRLQT